MDDLSRGCQQPHRHVPFAQDRKAPFVQAQKLGQDLRAVTEPVTGCWIQGKPHFSPPFMRRSRELAVQDAPRTCDWRSLENTFSALVTSRTTPSGWRHAPLPTTASQRMRRRSSLSGHPRRRQSIGGRQRSPAGRTGKARTGRRSRLPCSGQCALVSAMPHAVVARATSTPAPIDAPILPNSTGA